MKSQKGSAVIWIIVVLIVIIVGAAYLYQQQNANRPTTVATIVIPTEQSSSIPSGYTLVTNSTSGLTFAIPESWSATSSGAGVVHQYDSADYALNFQASTCTAYGGCPLVRGAYLTVQDQDIEKSIQTASAFEKFIVSTNSNNYAIDTPLPAPTADAIVIRRTQSPSQMPPIFIEEADVLKNNKEYILTVGVLTSFVDARTILASALLTLK